MHKIDTLEFIGTSNVKKKAFNSLVRIHFILNKDLQSVI